MQLGNFGKRGKSGSTSGRLFMCNKHYQNYSSQWWRYNGTGERKLFETEALIQLRLRCRVLADADVFLQILDCDTDESIGHWFVDAFYVSQLDKELREKIELVDIHFHVTARVGSKS